ncbi:MAG: glycosyltransferase family 2 protein [Flavobacteriaceae bacterium]|nr:glycosyltransferase family 2 protein [Flavobacteriaceae bacterium]
MTLSVIILNYKVRYFLEQCIKSVLLATSHIDTEIIVVDNDSNDGSCDMVRSLFPSITLIENKENVGFSKANNQGVAVAKGTYVCILNPDTIVSASCFSQCIRINEQVDNVGAIGPYLLDGTGNFLPESKRNLPTPTISLLKLMGFTRPYYANTIDDESLEEVDVLVGAFMFMKRAVYLEVGGFDEDYFMYGEDIDLSYKITMAGYKNYYAGTIKVLHYKGESTQKDAVYLDRFYGAMSIFYKKHYGGKHWLNSLVNLGVRIAKVMKGSSSSERRKVNKDEEKPILLLTENFRLLKEISNSTKLQLTAASKAIFQDTLYENHLFIFDAEYMPYAQIFKVMQQQKNRGNLFRIHPPTAQFFLGSDTSDEKGQVVTF